MQGTLVMLVGLSGLGCHNKGCDVAYVSPTYSSCFASAVLCELACHVRRATRVAMPAATAAATAAVMAAAATGLIRRLPTAAVAMEGSAAAVSGRATAAVSRVATAAVAIPASIVVLAVAMVADCSAASTRSERPATWILAMARHVAVAYASAYAPPVFGSALGMSYPPYYTMESPTAAACGGWRDNRCNDSWHTGFPTGTRSRPKRSRRSRRTR